MSRSVANVIASEQRRAQLAQMGWQVVDPVLGGLSSHQKHDWAKRVWQSDPEANRRHAYKYQALAVQSQLKMLEGVVQGSAGRMRQLCSLVWG